MASNVELTLQLEAANIQNEYLQDQLDRSNAANKKLTKALKAANNKKEELQDRLDDAFLNRSQAVAQVAAVKKEFWDFKRRLNGTLRGNDFLSKEQEYISASDTDGESETEYETDDDFTLVGVEHDKIHVKAGPGYEDY